MPSDEAVSSRENLTVRNRVNMVAGIVVQVILLGIWFLNDPLEFQGPLPPGESATRGEAVIMALIMGLIGIFSMAFFWYPRVQVEADRIVVYNPASTVASQKAAISEVDTTARHVRLRVDGRWIRCWGLETSLWMQLTHNDRRWKSQVRPAIQPTASTVASAAAIDRRWKRPTPVEVAVAGVWLALLVLSVVLR